MSNQDTITSFLRGKGLTTAQIAGVEGNLKIESGFSPTAYNAGERAIGIAQWEGSRRTALQAYARKAGTSETNLLTQLGFLWHELTTSESASLTALRATSTPAAAAAAFDKRFERSSGAARSERESAATAIARTLGGVDTSVGGLANAPVVGAKVSTPFGKTGPLWSNTGGKHTGDDYAVPIGTAVYATASGIVEAAGASGSGFGNWVKVKLANGYEAIYGHLSSEKVKVGDKVTAGQQIALSGASGNVTGPHLHYEVRKDGTPVNPTTASFMPVDWWNPLDGLGVAGGAIGDAGGALGGALGGVGGAIGGAIGDGTQAIAEATGKAIASAFGAAAGSSQVRDLATRTLFVGLGVALVVVGAAKLASPAVKPLEQAATAAATKGAA